MLLRRRPVAEEIFFLNAVVSFLLATVWLWWRRSLLLEYFYFAPLLALTHLVTLGFLSSLMMGMLHRLAPMLLGVEPGSRRILRIQLVVFLTGAWGMIAHFFLGEWVGMSWSAILLWVAAVLQIANFRGLLRTAPGSRKDPWPRRFVASSLVYFLLASSLGALLALAKAYDLRFPFLAPRHLSNLFAHAHLAGVGWVSAMILGFQLQLVPTTEGNPKSLPYRFALLHLGTLGLAGGWLLGGPVVPAALALAVCFVWQTHGPLSALLRGRAREWELLPLLVLVLTACLGVALAFGVPPDIDPLRSRLQLAYGFLGLYGFMALTVVTVAFKLFPIWVWKERFLPHFGKRPIPGMKDLPSRGLRWFANVGVFAGTLATAAAIALGSESALAATTTLLAAGVLAFAANLFLVLRFSFLGASESPAEQTRGPEDRDSAAPA